MYIYIYIVFFFYIFNIIDELAYPYEEVNPIIPIGVYLQFVYLPCNTLCSITPSIM